MHTIDDGFGEIDDGFGEEDSTAALDALEAQMALDDALLEARLDAARVWECPAYFGGCPT